MKKSYFGLKIGKAFSSPVSASEPSIMIGKILKYTLKVVSVLVAIVLLILLLLYMPFVQDFVKSEGFDYIQRKTQMHLSAERIRLSFPLKLVVDRAYAVRPTATRCFAASGWTRMSRYGRYCVRRLSSAASCSTVRRCIIGTRPPLSI